MKKGSYPEMCGHISTIGSVGLRGVLMEMFKRSAMWIMGAEGTQQVEETTALAWCGWFGFVRGVVGFDKRMGSKYKIFELTLPDIPFFHG
jgi:hypothetical protein